MPNNAKIILRGNLVRDPETREVNGSNVTSFTVAVSTRVKKEDGTYDTNFHDCSLWGKPGDYFKDRAKKGMLVDVIGEFQGRRTSVPSALRCLSRRCSDPSSAYRWS